MILKNFFKTKQYLFAIIVVFSLIILGNSILIQSGHNLTQLDNSPSNDIPIPKMKTTLTVQINPFFVDGNANFTNYGLFNGTGTSADPYSLSSVLIQAGANPGVSISNTNAYFELVGIEVNGSSVTGIRLNNVTNAYLFNNTVSNSAGGFELIGSSTFNTLEGNRALDNTGRGFQLSTGSDFNSLDNNYAAGNVDHGFATESNNNTIFNNEAFNNDHHGFFFWFASGNDIQYNDAFLNADGIVLWSDSYQNTLGFNEVKDSTYSGFVSWNNIDNTWHDNIAIGNGKDGFLIFYMSNNNSLTNNIATNNGENGFRILQSEFNSLTSNIANTNGFNGIELNEASFSNDLISNEAQHNTFSGVYLRNASFNIIKDNDASFNDVSGITLSLDATDNLLFDNDASFNKRSGMYIAGINNIFDNNSVERNNDNGFFLTFSAFDNGFTTNKVIYNSGPAVQLDQDTFTNTFEFNDFIGTFPKDDGTDNVFDSNFYFFCEGSPDVFHINGEASNSDFNPSLVPYSGDYLIENHPCIIDFPKEVRIDLVNLNGTIVSWHVTGEGDFTIIKDSEEIGRGVFENDSFVSIPFDPSQFPVGEYKVTLIIENDFGGHSATILLIIIDSSSTDPNNTDTNNTDTSSSTITIISTTPGFNGLFVIFSIGLFVLLNRRSKH